MLKDILIDLDGVIIPRQEYFSETFSREHSVPIDKIMPFFKNEYRLAAVGKIDVKDALPPYLKLWNWTKSVDAFIDYWLSCEQNIDTELLSVVREIRKRNIRVSIVSDNESHRAKHVWSTLDLKQEFDRALFSCDIGHTKDEPAFFSKVLSELKTAPENNYYWDDDSKNIGVAATLGIQGSVYHSIAEFRDWAATI